MIPVFERRVDMVGRNSEASQDYCWHWVNGLQPRFILPSERLLSTWLWNIVGWSLS